MDLYNLVDVAITAGFRIDAQWGFFFTIHLAILGGIIYVDRPLQIGEKVIALVLYTGFAVMNYFGLSVQQDLLDAAIQQIYQLKGEPCCTDNTIVDYYINLAEQGHREISRNVALSAHVLALLVVVASIVTDQSKKKIMEAAQATNTADTE